jgi:hypothetical protein
LAATTAGGVAQGKAGDPVRVRLATCEPWQCGTLNGVQGDCAGSANGYGNTSADRHTRFTFLIEKRDPTDKASDEVANTNKIEICVLLADGTESCPGTSPFILFDAADPNKKLDASMVADSNNAPLSEPIDLPLDFDFLAGAGWFLTIRVNGLGTPQDHANQAGFCTPFQKLAPIGANDSFQIYGLASRPAPFGYDLCTEAARVNWRSPYGNLSPPRWIGIARPLLTPVDRAIAFEERAEDLVDAGQLDAARTQILSSLPEVEEGFARAVKSLANAGVQHADAVHVVTTLAKIHGLKVSAAALLKPKTLGIGLSKLHEALELENGLAAFADEKGIEL